MSARVSLILKALSGWLDGHAKGWGERFLMILCLILAVSWCLLLCLGCILQLCDRVLLFGGPAVVEVRVRGERGEGRDKEKGKGKEG